MKWFKRIYGTVLAVFTVYILLDTFVLSEVYTIPEVIPTSSEDYEITMPAMETLPDESTDIPLSDENYY